MPRIGHSQRLYGGMEFDEWLDRRRAEEELRKAVYDLRHRGESLDMDLDEYEMPSMRKKDLAGMSADEIRAAAEDIRADIRSAEREWFDGAMEGVTSPAECVELLLDLAGNKANKKALRERLNADSNDLIKLADELLSMDKADRAWYLNNETRAMQAQQRADERRMLGSAEFMAKVTEDAKSWMK